MTAKTIFKILLVVALIYIAGQPLGQMITSIGSALITVGHSISSIGANFHPGG